MNPTDWTRLKVCFSEAIALSGAARVDYLRNLSKQESQDFLNELTGLLTEGREGSGDPSAIEDAFAQAISGAAEELIAIDQPREGDRLGAYRLLEQIGEGGMGRVYRAARSEGQFDQIVAIKLINSNIAKPELVDRFVRERQILADLSHPNICKLHDGGTSTNGSPYLVMELVEGMPLNDYARSKALSLKQRIALLAQVCKTVDYAHRKLVVHRDLKPANILVERSGQVKLLDFGIAKLLADDLISPDLTLPAAQPMTAAYASPEQVLGNSIGVASDIYSLGVIAYQLLAGKDPYDTRKATPAQLQERVCELPPERPSHTDTTSNRLAPNDPQAHAWRAELRGDLDNILLKALRKEPDQRYESAGAMAKDLERFLSHKPVLAHPPSPSYRTKKFIRRNRLAVFGGLGSLALIVGVTAYYTWQLTHERDRARLAATKSEEVVQFMISLFQSSAPDRALGQAVSARSLLDQGVARAGELAPQAEVQAALQRAMGEAYLGLGLFKESQPLLDASLASRRRILGDSHPDTLQSRTAIARLGLLAGTHADAAQELENALSVSRELLGEQATATLEIRRLLGVALRQTGEFDAAEKQLRTALDNHSSEDLLQARIKAELGALLDGIARPAEAIALLNDALTIINRVATDSHPAYQVAAEHLGLAHLSIGDHANATSIFEDNLKRARRIYGDGHPFTASSLGSLAAASIESGQLDKAEIYLKEELAVWTDAAGDRHPMVALASNDLGSTLSRSGRNDEAEVFYKNAIRINREIFGLDHRETATSISNLGVLLRNTQRTEEAEANIRLALRIRQRVLGDTHPEVLTSRAILADSLRMMNKLSEADQQLALVLTQRKKILGEEHPHYALSLTSLGTLRREQGQLDDARRALEDADERLRRAYAPDHRRVAHNLVILGTVEELAGDLASATRRFQQATEMFHKINALQHPSLATAQNRLDLLANSER